MQDESHGPGLDIGARLRAIRTARGLSQRELARRAGVTNALVSQIEQNASSPSVSTLKRILDALPMALSEFFAEAEPDGPRIFFSAAELRELNPARISRRKGAAGGISLRQVGDGATHAIQMLHETYAPGADTGPGLYAHQAEEAGIVVSGRIEITVGEETAELGPGDAYLFDSRVPHRFRNASDEDCVIVSACTPPSF